MDRSLFSFPQAVLHPWLEIVGCKVWIQLLWLIQSERPSVHNRLRISRRPPFFHLTHEPTHLFRISRCRHVWTISRSPQRGSQGGKKKNKFRNLPFLAHSSIFNHVIFHSLPSHLLPLQYWLKPSIERWGREPQTSFRSYGSCLSSWLMASAGSDMLYPNSIHSNIVTRL